MLRLMLPERVEAVLAYRPDPALEARIEELAGKSTEGHSKIVGGIRHGVLTASATTGRSRASSVSSLSRAGSLPGTR